MPMSREIARAFMFGVVPHGGVFPEPEKDALIPAPGPLPYDGTNGQKGITDAERDKIREMFAPKESGE